MSIPFQGPEPDPVGGPIQGAFQTPAPSPPQGALSGPLNGPGQDRQGQDRQKLDRQALDRQALEQGLERGLVTSPLSGPTRSPTGGLPPISNFPDQALPFEGRDDQIAELVELFGRYGHVLLHDQKEWRHGFGKSQMAIAYCRRYTIRYDVAWWFSCEGETDEEGLRRLIDDQYRQLRELCERTSGSPHEVRPDQRWLFVYDGVPNPDRIVEYFVPGSSHRLVTCRSAGETWGKNRLALGGLTERQAKALLLKQAETLTVQEAGQLASLMNGNPGQLLLVAEIARDRGFESCLRALTSVPEGSDDTPPGGIAVPFPTPRRERGMRLGPEDRRTLIETLLNSEVGRTRETYDVWIDSIRIAISPETLPSVNDGGFVRTRIVSVVNSAVRHASPRLLVAIAGATSDQADEEAGAVVRRLVDNAVRTWDDH